MKRISLPSLTGILLALVALDGLADTRLYKYTDENGRVHYTDQPPAEQQAETLDIKVKTYTGPARVMDYAAVLSAGADNDKVTIYTTEWCSVCKKAKRYMDSQDIAYTEHDIEKSDKAKREFDRLGGKGVPVILVGRQKMHGFNPQRLESMMTGQ